MDIINSLKSRIGGAEEVKLSQFLGESIKSVDKSMDLSLNAMLGGLKEIARKEGDASSIMKVINDGGHSGDLTDDLAWLFKNSDKIQLLITIGKNINKYFFKDKVDGIIEMISSNGSISKTSASSLLSLAAPLVLGTLGKNIRLEGLDNFSFTSRLLNENLTGASDINDNLELLAESNKAAIEKEEFVQQKKVKSDDTLNWFAWVMLGLLGLAVAYYTLKDKYKSETEADVEVSLQDSLAYKNEEDIFDALNTDRNKNIENKETGKVTTKDQTVLENSTPIDNSSEVKSNSSIRNNTNNSSINRIESSSNTDRSTQGAIQGPTSDNRPMSAKLDRPGVFFGINGLNYRNKSAEITNRGAVRDLVNYLNRNPNRKIQIGGTGSSNRLAEDRAYGLQGVLFELGVDVRQTEILSYPVPGDGPIMVKIK